MGLAAGESSEGSSVVGASIAFLFIGLLVGAGAIYWLRVRKSNGGKLPSPSPVPSSRPDDEGAAALAAEVRQLWQEIDGSQKVLPSGITVVSDAERRNANILVSPSRGGGSARTAQARPATRSPPGAAGMLGASAAQPREVQMGWLNRAEADAVRNGEESHPTTPRDEMSSHRGPARLEKARLPEPSVLPAPRLGSGTPIPQRTAQSPSDPELRV